MSQNKTDNTNFLTAEYVRNEIMRFWRFATDSRNSLKDMDTAFGTIAISVSNMKKEEFEKIRSQWECISTEWSMRRSYMTMYYQEAQ